jgi:hypothetical protein
MQERRRQKRFKRRMMVKFGEQDLTFSGFTADVSPTGAFIVSPSRPTIDTRIHLQIFPTPQKCVYFEGVVRRHRVVPAELRHSEKGGFGVRLLPPDEVLSEIVVALANSLDVHYATREQLKKAHQVELRFGGVFVHTDRHLPADTEVTLTFYLDFADKSFEAEGTVVQVAKQASQNGVAIIFKQPKQVDAKIRPHLT